MRKFQLTHTLKTTYTEHFQLRSSENTASLYARTHPHPFLHFFTPPEFKNNLTYCSQWQRLHIMLFWNEFGNRECRTDCLASDVMLVAGFVYTLVRARENRKNRESANALHNPSEYIIRSNILYVIVKLLPAPVWVCGTRSIRYSADPHMAMWWSITRSEKHDTAGLRLNVRTRGEFMMSINSTIQNPRNALADERLLGSPLAKEITQPHFGRGGTSLLVPQKHFCFTLCLWVYCKCINTCVCVCDIIEGLCEPDPYVWYVAFSTCNALCLPG